VVFIPKAGKATHTTAKNFRPISLASFLLKSFERMISLHIRTTIDPTFLEGGGSKVVAYADDVAIIFNGKYPQTLLLS